MFNKSSAKNISLKNLVYFFKIINLNDLTSLIDSASYSDFLSKIFKRSIKPVVCLTTKKLFKQQFKY
jgi:hypothetical protein